MAIMTNQISHVTVDVSTFEEFFKEKAIYPIGIDTYQRPYVWSIDKVKELINDLMEHLESQPGTPYYMGSILLHQNDEKQKLFIIDGQQRMTTLSILYYILNGRLLDKQMKMKFNSPTSIKHIKKIQLFFSQDANEGWKEKISLLFPYIQFTFITTPSEDLAFTFFDTQNYRGVKLNPTDLLKAYHLRAINDIKVQEVCAKDWERIQNYQPLMSRKGDFISELFHKFLWRARCWRGQRQMKLALDVDILIEFMKNTKPNEGDHTVDLYPNFNNWYGTKLHFNEYHHFEVHTQEDDAYEYLNLPFTLRQPINKGLGYFLFSMKYAEVAHVLFTKATMVSKEIKRFREFYNDVWKHLSVYLKELFILASIMYYDKFGDRELFRFSLWLDHVLGAIRLEKKNVVKQAPLKFLMEREHNLLDVISYAFIPDEVFQFLANCSEKIDIYETESIEWGRGVQGDYKRRILTYYSKDSFCHKESWMDQLIGEMNNGN